MASTKLLEIAVAAAKEAGRIQRIWLHRDKKIEFKSEIDLVTDVDRRCEEKIVGIVQEHFPQHAILTEETTMPERFSPYRWIVDPLDGTTNYAHAYPCFSTSIALEREGEIILGVVYDPTLDELFTAEKGAGAFLNGERLTVSVTARLSEALIGTGFPYDLRQSADNNVAHFNNFLMRALAVRRIGSAALELCYVGKGRFDGFWGVKLYPWDVAAGKLVVEEAGGSVTDFRGKSFDLYGPEILATNSQIHQEMMQVLQMDS